MDKEGVAWPLEKREIVGLVSRFFSTLNSQQGRCWQTQATSPTTMVSILSWIKDGMELKGCKPGTLAAFLDTRATAATGWSWALAMLSKYFPVVVEYRRPGRKAEFCRLGTRKGTSRYPRWNNENDFAIAAHLFI